ncbi:MAG: helix-turn-helix domain-containing protein [Candidatus Bathyarchaeia archaeon]|nr:MarR family transcriptional regulator [Candidatus Bathyarchaeota archaeon]
MDIILMLVYATFFSITSTFLLAYFRRLRNINLEYMKIKKALEDIIFSFNKDLQKIEGQIQEISRKIDVDKGRDDMRVLLNDLKSRLEDLVSFKERISAEIEKMRSEIEKLFVKCSEVEAKVRDFRLIEGERRQEFYGGGPVKLPIHKFVKEDRALAPLTATEMRVLEILATEGEKTVSEIRNRIGLTREHTARLMKSLYERGYVERKDDKVPYVYRLAREMEEIIKDRKSE